MNKIIPAPKSFQWSEKVFSNVFPLRLNAKSELGFATVFEAFAAYLTFEEKDANVLLDVKAEWGDALGEEGYRLRVEEEVIRIEAGSKVGAFYGLQSLLQLLPFDEPNATFSIPQGVIEDTPQYGWRGFMFDEARHFFGKETVKKILDWMAAYKLNRFHWHLTDDQGWRVEIKAYPKLTEIGSVRKGTRYGAFRGPFKDEYVAKPHGGFYTQEDIREIVAYAKERQIEVIPEFDLPGHFSSVLAAYPALGCTGEPVEVKEGSGIFGDIACVGNSAAVDLIKTVIDELCDLFPFPYFHIGGDEVKTDNWETCPKCQGLMQEKGIDSLHGLQVYLTNEMTAYLKAKGRTTLVWNEALGEDLDEDVVLLHWISFGKHFEKTIGAMKAGRKGIMQPIFTTYFDYSYALVPIRKINRYDETKGLEGDGLQQLMGVQCALWTEQINNEAHVQFNCFPKMALMAEAGWGTRVADGGQDFMQRWDAGKSHQELMGLVHAAPLKAVNPWGLRRWWMTAKCMLKDMRSEVRKWQS